MNIFKKKLAEESALPVDKSLAVPGFTKVLKKFADAQKMMEPDYLSIYLYVTDRKADQRYCYLATTFFARINDHSRKPEYGFSMVFNKTILGDMYDAFVESDVAKVFTKEKGVIDSPDCLHEKCEYYIKDFGYDAQEASAVIAMLLDQVYHVNPEDAILTIQVFGWEDEQSGQDSTTDFDFSGKLIGQSGFKHDLF